MTDLHRVLVRPLVTEKSSALYGALKEYTFVANPHATKADIRRAIEQLFDVTVVRVRTLQQRSARKTMGRHEGRRPRWKKAYVRLKDGDSLPIFEG
ncbi:MAG: 50S ribosomal protein L23 [Gemmatimonadetes bacterium RBG_16_66_8]|nr:MAG: 50S ribosomal protein L23 [Gemmatimonadetes bacterium RBG_16_66_8]